MTMFVFLPDQDKGSAELLPVLGAGERLAQGNWKSAIEAFQEAAGGATSEFQGWSVYEVSEPDPERLAMVTEAIVQQLNAQSEAAIDMALRMVTLPELHAIAAGMSLAVELVAILKPREGAPLPLVEPLDNELLAAIQAMGGTVSTGQLAARMNMRPVTVRRRLQVLVRFRRLIATGKKGGTRYSLSKTS
ncbi:MAG TPA: hypothetical protein VF173_05850 [Thermoanaerobaculia bacterium]|nr:hypothetical protein [Thermoanaerobaculia bacterium]